MSWNDLFVNMDNTNFFNFSFLPKYGSAFVRGFEYTLLLAVVSVLLAVIPALLLAMMRLSKIKPIKWFAGAYIAVFRSTPMLVQLSIIYFGLFHYITLPRTLLFGFIAVNRFIPGVVALALNSSAYVAEIFRAGILWTRGRPRRPVLWVSAVGSPCVWSCCPRPSRMSSLPWPMRSLPW